MLLLTFVVATRLLLASRAVMLASPTATTATISSPASMTSGGDGGKQGGVVFHWLLDGGHQVGLLAVHGTQLVRLVDQQPHVLMVVFTQHDAQLRRQPAHEEVGEEEAGLLSARAKLQYCFNFGRSALA